MKVVIDTNVLVSALSRKSQYHWLVQQLLDEKINVHVLMKYCWNRKKF